MMTKSRTTSPMAVELRTGPPSGSFCLVLRRSGQPTERVDGRSVTCVRSQGAVDTGAEHRSAATQSCASEDTVSEDRELVLYTRARCGVCRLAEEQVRRELRRTAPWRRPKLRLVDIDAGPAAEGEGLATRYGVRVPVLVLDGVEISELQLEPGVVRRALRGGGRQSPRQGMRPSGGAR